MKKIDYIALSIVIGILLTVGTIYYFKYNNNKDSNNSSLVAINLPNKIDFNKDSIKIITLNDSLHKLTIKNRKLLDEIITTRGAYEKLESQYTLQLSKLKKTSDIVLCEGCIELEKNYKTLLGIDSLKTDRITELNGQLDEASEKISETTSLAEEITAYKNIVFEMNKNRMECDSSYTQLAVKYNKTQEELDKTLLQLNSKNKNKIKGWVVATSIVAGLIIGKKIK